MFKYKTSWLYDQLLLIVVIVVNCTIHQIINLPVLYKIVIILSIVIIIYIFHFTWLRFFIFKKQYKYILDRKMNWFKDNYLIEPCYCLYVIIININLLIDFKKKNNKKKGKKKLILNRLLWWWISFRGPSIIFAKKIILQKIYGLYILSNNNKNWLGIYLLNNNLYLE